jgi:hypothetical protein
MIATICGVWSEFCDDPRVIKEVSAVVNRFVQGYARDSQGKMSAEAFLASPSWDDVKAAAYRLTSSNRGIVRAKALVVLDRHPESYSEYEWRERFDDAAKSYRECTSSKRAAVSFGFGALALIATVPATWLLLLLISWLWYFGLDRIRELSTAIRARRDDDEA